MRLVKNVRYAILAFVVFVCEMTFGKYLQIAGVIPMLTFSFCVTAAACEEDFGYILRISLALGIILDVFSGHGFGTYTLTYTLAALATYTVRDSLFSSKLLFLAFDAFVMTVFLNVIYYLFHIIDIGNGFWEVFSGIMVPQALYNTCVSLIFYGVLKAVFRR